MFSQINVIGVFLTIISVVYGISDSRGINLSGCRNLTTNDYAFTFYPIKEIKNKDGIFLEGNLRTGREGFIIFSSTNKQPELGQKVFEVVLGFNVEGDTISEIRPTSLGGNVIKHMVGNITLSKKWRQFWIRITYNSNGTVIQNGEPGVNEPVPVEAPESRLIKYYGFASSANKNIVDWAFLCPSHKDSDYVDHRYVKNLTTTKYEYQLLSIDEIKNGNGILLNFSVNADRDAHIVFSSTNKTMKGEKAYEIVLGAYANTESVIRTSPEGNEVAKHEEQNILSSKEWRQFWIRISSGGLIEVGREGSSPFMSWKDQNLMNISHFGFASWKNGNTVNWTIQRSTK